MNTHSQTGTSLAADIVNDLISLDAKLGHCDEEDSAELAERLTTLDASEIRHILNLLLERGVVLAAPVPVTAVAEEVSQ
jgi:hypothetical protein